MLPGYKNVSGYSMPWYSYYQRSDGALIELQYFYYNGDLSLGSTSNIVVSGQASPAPKLRTPIAAVGWVNETGATSVCAGGQHMDRALRS